MNFGPWLEWATGLIGLGGALAVVELGLLAVRLGPRAGAGEDPL